VLTITLMCVDIGSKALLFLYCRRYASRSPLTAALAQDHRNDIVVNSVALGSSLIGAGGAPLHAFVRLPRR